MLGDGLKIEVGIPLPCSQDINQGSGGVGTMVNILYFSFYECSMLFTVWITIWLDLEFVIL